MGQAQFLVPHPGIIILKMEFEFDYIKITNDEYPSGYFFHLANSRSGHNFIKKNIQSWTNDIDASIR